MSLKLLEHNYECATQEQAHEICECLRSQLEYIHESFPNVFIKDNEDNLIKTSEEIKARITEFYVNRDMNSMIDIENRLLELLDASFSANLVYVEPSEQGYVLTRKHFLEMGYTNEQLKRMAKIFLED